MNVSHMMKKMLCVSLFCMTAYSAEIMADNSVYGQFSSSKTQIPGLKNSKKEISEEDQLTDKPGWTSKLVKFENIDSKSGLKIENNKKIIVQHDGVYYISITGQVGAKGLSLFGDVRLGIIHNGKKLKNSLATQTVAQIPSVYSLTTHYTLFLHEGDTLSVGLLTETSTLGLIATPDGSPSIIVSIFKI